MPLQTSQGLGSPEDAGNAPPALPAPGYYNTDLDNAPAGPVVTSAQHHPIYVNKPASHWGDAAAFLTDLGKSQFIHLLDQYVGNFADNRYTVGTSFQATMAIPAADHTLQKADILALVHAAALQGGTGFTHIYHVFLPQGVDVCFKASFCYSPDVPAAFAFCALHDSAVFNDLGRVLFTLEPYQNTLGCSAPPHTTPNGQIADSTDYSLSHEVFEIITDPVVGRGWTVRKGATASGQEMADLCTLGTFSTDGNIYTSAPDSRLNGNHYRIQAEYSNLIHGCLYPAASDGNQ